MIQALIVEDERLSADRLKKMIEKVDPEVQIMDILDSVESSLEWYRDNSPPDLIFLDIQLNDGTGLDFLRDSNCKCPIIFTTAYDDYAIKAFRYNSLDYLLKPIEEEDLKRAIEKFKEYTSQPEFRDNPVYPEVQRIISKEFKKRFLVKLGDQLKPIDVEDIAYFVYEKGLTSLLTHDGEKWPVDHSLEQVEELINPLEFYRVNRQTLISLKSIKEIHTYFNSRLLLNLNPSLDQDVIVARERVAHFKKWMDL